MCTRWLLVLLPCAGIVASTVGCKESVPADLRYSVALKNVGTNELDDATVRFGDFYDEPGVLPAGVEKVVYAAFTGFPDSATLTWTRQDGLRREKTVAVKAPPPSRYHVRFWFLIEDNDEVTCRVEEIKERPL